MFSGVFGAEWRVFTNIVILKPNFTYINIVHADNNNITQSLHSVVPLIVCSVIIRATLQPESMSSFASLYSFNLPLFIFLQVLNIFIQLLLWHCMPGPISYRSRKFCSLYIASYSFLHKCRRLSSCNYVYSYEIINIAQE